MSGDELLTVEEVADRLKTSAITIRRLCNDGEFDGAFVVSKRQWRIPAAAVEAYIQRQQAAQKWGE